ncbi:Glyoxylate reductase [Rhodopirellula islandica]|uniref:Glyoxylate/hydroxypyruvate reductase B n=1 Tax=Rhodopirellula islandica TaxID=595434 RepID=A0A0J1EJZ5_RHOIS|nr:D-glycerate dehydrogenase [Rhodopirellula islandica]KLU05839.1 Glyoxylate reductase [Rhodopirellula islandica]
MESHEAVKRPRVLVTRQTPGESLQRLREVCEVEVWPETMPPSREELCRLVKGRHGLLTMLSDRIDGEMMEIAGDQLAVISNYAVGFNNIDVDAAKTRGIAVGNTPDVLTDATADLAVALLFAASRHVLPAGNQVREGEWKTWEPTGWLGVEPAGKTLGIVGMGRIGRATARRLVGGWGMNLLYTSRSDQAEVEKELGGRRVELDTLLAESDFVSVHVALTDETRNLIDAEAISKMKSTSVLVNTARGEIVDQDALVEALENRSIFGAGLDVTTPEPLSAEHPLVKSAHCVILPHIGSATHTSRNAMAEIAVDNLIAGLSGRPLRCSVT